MTTTTTSRVPQLNPLWWTSLNTETRILPPYSCAIVTPTMVAIIYTTITCITGVVSCDSGPVTNAATGFSVIIFFS